MAYDEDLADRVREVMPADAEVTERKMFGGLAFLLRGHMFAGIVGSELMVRIGSEAAQRALELDHVREMDFTGRPMKNMIFVQPAGLDGPALERWVTAADFSGKLAVIGRARARFGAAVSAFDADGDGKLDLMFDEGLLRSKGNRLDAPVKLVFPVLGCGC